MSSTVGRAALIAAAALTFAALNSLAQTTAPARSLGPTWGSHPLPSDDKGADINAAIRDNASLMVLGRTGCPVLIIGEEVWDLKTQKRTGAAIPHNASRDSIASLSDDGSLLAVVPDGSPVRFGRTPAADATIWNTKTGAQVSVISSDERDLDIQYLAFAANQYLLICGRPHGSRTTNMEVWDVKTGKFVRRFPCNFSRTHDTTVSPDGRYLAVGDTQRVILYEIATGKELTSMVPPNTKPTNADGSPVRLGPSNRPFLSLRQLAFSPDGSGLVAATEVFKPRCTVWDNLGRVTADFQFHRVGFPGQSMRYLQWSPDRSAWLINENWLVDCKSQRAIWTYPVPDSEDPRALFIDDKHLFVIHNGQHPGGEVITIPWDAIHKSADAATNPKTPAWLRPGEKVSLEITFTHPLSEQAQATKLLTEEITGMLAEMNVQIADNQSSVVTVNLDEVVGDPLPIVERSIYSNLGNQPAASQPTGRQASPCKGIATLTLHARGSDAAIFTLRASAESSPQVLDTITSASLQRMMIGFVISRFRNSPFPYFISKDTPPVMLPIGIVPQNDVSANFLKSPFNLKTLVELYNPMDRHRRSAPPPAKPDPAVRL